MTVSHMWGINWQMYHKDREDMPHIERMGYRSFTIYEWMWSNRDFCNELLSVARSDAIFLDRDHPLSEQKDDEWKSDPALKGRKHADEWAKKVQEGRVYTPLDRTYFLGLNEPDSHQYQRQIDAYNEAYCRRLAEHGLQGAAYSFGVGQPSTFQLLPDTPPAWTWYEASAAAVIEGGHIAAFHEYGSPDGYGWEYWCNRSSYCPYPFNAVLDECGIDHGVLKQGDLVGWMRSLKPEEYISWLDGFQLGMVAREYTRKVKFLAYNIFSFDHGSGKNKDWHSFDIRPLRGLLESYQWSALPEPTKKPVKTHLPDISGGVSHTEEPMSNTIDPIVAEAILEIESGGRAFGEDGKLLIRFETHIFHRHMHDDRAFDQYFSYDQTQQWMNQKFRGKNIHTGSQVDEYAAFEFAKTLDSNAAHMAISMGSAQIMGFNYAGVGYTSPQAMYVSFQRSEQAQIIAFINFCLNNTALHKAIQVKDWCNIARYYNGAGNVDVYAPLLRQAYTRLQP